MAITLLSEPKITKQEEEESNYSWNKPARRGKFCTLVTFPYSLDKINNKKEKLFQSFTVL